MLRGMPAVFVERPSQCLGVIGLELACRSQQRASGKTGESVGDLFAITAVGLLRVIFHLRAIRASLVGVTGGVQAVAQLTSTVPDRLTSVNASLKPVRDFCETV